VYNFFPQTYFLAHPITLLSGKNPFINRIKIAKNHKYLQVSLCDLSLSISIFVAGENNLAINMKLFFSLAKYAESNASSTRLEKCGWFINFGATKD